MTNTSPARLISDETSRSSPTPDTSAASANTNPGFRVSEIKDIPAFIAGCREFERQRDEINATHADPPEPARRLELRRRLAAAKAAGPEAEAAVLATITEADRTLGSEWRAAVKETREKRAAALAELDKQAPHLAVTPSAEFSGAKGLTTLLGRIWEALEAAELDYYEIRVMIGRANVRTVVNTVKYLHEQNDEFPSAADVIEAMEGTEEFYDGPWGSDDAALEAGPAPNPRLAERIANAVFKHHEFEGRGMLRTTLYEQMRVRRETTQQNLQWCLRCGKVSEERGLLYPVGGDRAVLS